MTEETGAKAPAAEEVVSEWGDRWLSEWRERGRPEDADTRSFVADNWQRATLEKVMHWWQENNGQAWDEQFADLNSLNHLTMYASERAGLSVWRAFSEYRHRGLPVPEHILRKFDQWAERLEVAESPIEAARAIEMAAKGWGGSVPRHLERAERTRAIATEIHRQLNHPNRRQRSVHQADSAVFLSVAKQFGAKPDAVKKLWQRWKARSKPRELTPVSSVFEWGRNLRK